MATRLRSFAKINLGLAIGPVRGDGFHELLTVYQTIGLHDVVTVEARRVRPAGGMDTASRGQIVIESNDPRVPTDERNTAWRMVDATLRRAGVAAEVRLQIDKRLPVQGGLGAGSANAAAALLGLERELGVAPGDAGWLTGAERLEIAAGVGSDVPLFLIGGTVLGEGRGERLRALGDLDGGQTRGEELGKDELPAVEEPGLPCVVAVPRLGVSTPAAFRAWDERVAAATAEERDGRAGRATPTGPLTPPGVPANITELSLAYAAAFGGPEVNATKPDPLGTVGDTGLPRQPVGHDGRAENSLLTLVRTGIANDFEEVVFSQHSLLRSTKRLLMGCDSGEPAVYAALSGSGSALFGLYRTMEGARAAQQRVEAWGVQALLTETLSRARYWSEMVL